MRRTFLGLTAAILLATGLALSSRLIPAAPVTHVRTVAAVAVTAPAETTTTVDWRPAVRYTVAIQAARAEHRRVVLAIRYATAIAEQEQLARRLVSNHAAVVPKPPAWKPAWTDNRFGTVPFDPTTQPDWPMWRCTAMHEAGCVCWANEAGPFSGPFDIARTTWRAYGGVYAQRWPDAATAPPWAQVAGARLVRAAVGSSKWGGLRTCGG